MVRRTLILILLVGLLSTGCGDDEPATASSPEEAAPVSQEAVSVSAMVMEAWATGEQADIDAIYAEDVRMVLDDETVAENRDEISSVITGAIAFGNTYRQVGPVTEYVVTDGDQYVATLVEVVGAGHPDGDPIVGFYRVRDGKVIRHVFIDAEHY